MWQSPQHHPRQCSSSMERIQSGTLHRQLPSSHQHHNHHHHAAGSEPGKSILVKSRRYMGAPSTSNSNGPHTSATSLAQLYLQFPPPPNYPPYPSTSKMSEDHLLSAPGPSTQQQPPPSQQPMWDVMPNDYSYAYYEPGPPTIHTNIPSNYPGAYREGSYRTRHTYMTRYGTEENIYEEISDIARARMHQESRMSLNQSAVEDELRRVQSRHRRVLGELNLSVEAMLMPSNSREGSDDTEEGEDQLADLMTVGPTDELLSPIPLVDLDSGFSGSSSGASYRSAAGSLRRGPPDRPKSANSYGPRSSTPAESITSSNGKGFWGKKAWKKIASFPSNINLSKHKDTRGFGVQG